MGENTVKGGKGVFQGFHMTFFSFVLIYNFKFYILDI